MRVSSKKYKALLEQPNSRFLIYVENKTDGVTYGPDMVKEATVNSALFDGEPGVGNCISGELDLVIRSPEMYAANRKEPSEGAELEVNAVLVGEEAYERVSNGESADSVRAELPDQFSETVYIGVYFIDTRETDVNTGNMSFHCYDVIMQLDRDFIYNGQQTGWCVRDRDAISTIRSICGVYISDTYVNKNLYVAYPDGESGVCTCREVLAQIGAMYGGNWAVSYRFKGVGLGLDRDIAMYRFGQERGPNLLATENRDILLVNGMALLVSGNESSYIEDVFYAGNAASSVTYGKPYRRYTAVEFDIGDIHFDDGSTAGFKVYYIENIGSYFVWNNEIIKFDEEHDERVSAIPQTDGTMLKIYCPMLGGDPKYINQYRQDIKAKTSFSNNVYSITEGQKEYINSRTTYCIRAALNIYKLIVGYVYQPFQADGVIVDPAAELGDAIEVGGVHSVIGSLRMRVDALCGGDIEAPGSQETHEFVSSENRETARSISGAAMTGGGDYSASTSGYGRTTALDFSTLSAGYFTEKIDGDGTLYVFGVKTADGRTTITYPDGKTMTVKL